MSIARYFTAGLLAVVVTLLLLLLMHVLIQSDVEGPDEVIQYKVPDILMPETEITTEFDTSKPDKPEDVDEPPPDIPEPEFDSPELSRDAIKIKPKFDGKPKIGGITGVGDGDMIPLTVVQPEYPRRAAQKGTEGYCVIEFTVTAAGTTREPTAVDCPNKMFVKSSLKASARVKYKPRVVDGVPVDVKGVRYKFVYQMQK